jgi:hypothetical protein
MSCSKLVLAVALVCGGCSPAFSKTVLTCPEAVGGHKLSAVDMFSGPPVEMASLIPVDGVWDTTMDNQQELPFFLQCAYAHTKKTVVIRVPATMKSCEYGEKNNQVFCR